MIDRRLTRAEARRLVVAEDAYRREQMPIARKRPPLTPEDIDAAMPDASARHAFWKDARTARPIDDAIANATPGQIIAYCVPYSHEDICNGGFHQYFSNHGGAFARITIEAVRKIGDDARAELMTRAMARFPDGVAPNSRAECQAALARIDFKTDWRPWIEPIERAYYALGRADLKRRIRDYVVSHPKEFFLDD